MSGSVILHQSVDDGNMIEAEMKTLRSIMRELGHNHIDILKMDIEGFEFKVVKNLMNPGLKAIDLKMCLMETHERFFAKAKNNYVNDLYNTMRKYGFADLYGTAREPTFVKI